MTHTQERQFIVFIAALVICGLVGAWYAERHPRPPALTAPTTVGIPVPTTTSTNVILGDSPLPSGTVTFSPLTSADLPVGRPTTYLQEQVLFNQQVTVDIKLITRQLQLLNGRVLKLERLLCGADLPGRRVLIDEAHAAGTHYGEPACAPVFHAAPTKEPTQ